MTGSHAGHGHQGAHEGPPPVVCAWRRGLRRAGGPSSAGDAHAAASELTVALRSLLAALPSVLRDCGCTLIGHVKGVLDAGAGGRAFFSITSFDGAPRLSGELGPPVDRCLLTMNVIVYGGDERSVDAAVLAAAGRHLAPWVLQGEATEATPGSPTDGAGQ
jgi:hypothetical protein